MKTNQNVRRALVTLSVASTVMAGCRGEDAATTATSPAPTEMAVGNARAEPRELVAQVGVEPGPVLQTGGAAAIVTAIDGDVTVRRLGEEGFASVKRGDSLYLGDQVRARDAARITVTFADESTAEVAEQSTMAIGSRVSTADPASSAAVLMGVARFSVTPRAPGEGPFMVFTPAGIIATKGTVFGVGVAADGDARVGVESGAVDVAGAVALDAPVSLEAEHAAELSAAGAVGAATAWPVDDWGAWRSQADAKLDIGATATFHADAMAALTAQLEATYAALAALGTQVASFEATAATAATAGDTARYEASLPEASLAIDASFLVGARLAFLTHAHAAHAALASELYLRYPDVVAWAKIESQVEASVLWPKRFDAMAVAYFEPLRVQYYLHHARGRAHAQFVGIVVPEFYARVTPPDVSASARAKLNFKVFTPSQVAFTASGRAVWIAAPSANWNARLKFKARAPRGKVAFWVRPPHLEGAAILGAQIKGTIAPVFAVRAPSIRGDLKAKWGIVLGQKIQISPPDLRASAKARAAWSVDATPPALNAKVAATIALPDVKGKLRASAKAHGKLGADARAKAKMQADAVGRAAASAKGQLKAGAGAAASIRIKAPEIKPPSVRAEAKGSAKFKLGN